MQGQKRAHQKNVYPLRNGYKQNNEYEKQKQQIIDRNYSSIYRDLLSDEGGTVYKKGPINIGNKDVYALSDIEGFNIDFLKFLQNLGLVKYSEEQPKNSQGWKSCASLTEDGKNIKTVYYHFNEDACRNFQDVIVLCGDYVRNQRKVSDGTVNILTELRQLLNFDKNNVGCGTEDKKKLFLIAGNHDIADYKPEIESNDCQHDLKTKVLQMGLYPQLLLVNGDGKKLLFQHTNFPYREKDNYIVNKKIDPEKASKLLEATAKADYKPILRDDGFFALRYTVNKVNSSEPFFEYSGMHSETNPNPSPLNREIYSDFGIGYDAKFIGHDANFSAWSQRIGGFGNVYNVNICNENEQHFATWKCKAKRNEQGKYNARKTALQRFGLISFLKYQQYQQQLASLIKDKKIKNQQCNDIIEEIKRKYDIKY